MGKYLYMPNYGIRLGSYKQIETIAKAINWYQIGPSIYWHPATASTAAIKINLRE